MSIIRIISSITILTLFFGAFPIQALETDAFNNSIPLSFPKIITLKEDAGKVSKKASKIAKPTPPKRVQKIVKQRVVRYKKVVVKKKIVRGKPPAQKKPVKSIVKPAHENVELPSNAFAPVPGANDPPSQVNPPIQVEVAPQVIEEPEQEQQTKEVKEIVEGELIVKFKEGTTPEQIDEVNARLSGSVKQNIDPDTYLIQINDGSGVEDKVAQYSSEAIVEYAEPNYIVKTVPVGEPVQLKEDDNQAPKANPEPATNNLNPTGSKKMFFYTGPVNYSQESDTETTIVEDSDNPNILTNGNELTFEVAFPRELSDEAPEAITFELKDKEAGISFKPIGIDTVRGSISGNSIIYRNIYEGVDLKFEVNDNSLKELIILNNKEAVRDFEFNFSYFGDVYLREEDRRINIYDKNTNEKLFSIPPIFMYDQTGLRTYNAQLQLDNSAGRLKLIYLLDDTWLDDPARVYPVAVDPAIKNDTGFDYNGPQNDDGYGDTYINGYDGNMIFPGLPSFYMPEYDNRNRSFDYSDLLYVGRSGNFMEWGIESTSFTLLKFDLAEFAQLNKDSEIYEASLYLIPFYERNAINNADTNTYRQLQLKAIAQDFNLEGATWTNASNIATRDDLAVNVKDVTPDGLIRFDIKNILLAWVNGTIKNNGLLLHIGDVNQNYQSDEDGFPDYFKMFASAESGMGPFLVVEYNNKPTVQALLPNNNGNYYPGRSPDKDNDGQPDEPYFVFTYRDKDGDGLIDGKIEVSSKRFEDDPTYVSSTDNIIVLPVSHTYSGEESYKRGVTVNEYLTLSELPQGTYYWRVKVTDGWPSNNPAYITSTYKKFKVLSAPQFTLDITSGIDKTANTARPTFKWTLADPDGDLMDSWLKVANNPYYDNGGDNWAVEQWYSDQPSGDMNGWVNTGVSFLSTYSAWKYKRTITITNPNTSALSNFQVLLTIDTATPISAGKMQANGADLRFVSTASGAELGYWVESGINTSATKIWVKVDSLAASPAKTYLYMFYGNSSAAAKNNPFDVFDYYFAGAALSGWTNSGALINSSAGNPAPSLQTNGGKYAYKDITLTLNSVLELDVYLVPGTISLANIFFKTNSAGKGQMFRLDGRSGYSSGFAGTTSWTSWKSPSGYPAVSTGTWYKVRIELRGSTAYAFINNSPFGSRAISNFGGFIGLHGDASTAVGARFDNVKMRKYIASQPTATTGAEQTYSIALDRTTYRTQNGGSNSLKVDAYGLGNFGYLGAMKSLNGIFYAGRTYRVNAYLKGDTAGAVQLLIGVSGDVAAMQADLTTSWQPYTLTWTPTANRTGVYIGTRTMSDLVYNMEDLEVYDLTVTPLVNMLENGGFDTVNEYTVPFDIKDGLYYFQLEVWDQIPGMINGWSSPSLSWSWTASKPIGGDFNNDGNDDLGMFYTSTSTTFYLFASNGLSSNGNLGSPISLWSGSFPYYKYIPGDFDGDGRTEIAAARDDGANGTSFWIFNDRDGAGGNWGFTNAYSATTLDTVRELGAGDFDGDGKDDLFVIKPISTYNSDAIILKSNSAGTSFSFTQLTVKNFTIPQNTGVPSSGVFENVIVGDYNGNGTSDLAVLYSYQDFQAWLVEIWILLSNGASLASPVKWYTNWHGNTQSAEYLGGADFDGDRKSDIAVVWSYDIPGILNIDYLLSKGYVSSGSGFRQNTWLSEAATGIVDLDSKVFLADFDSNGNPQDPRDNVGILYDNSNQVTAYLFKNKPFTSTKVTGEFVVDFENSTSQQPVSPSPGEVVYTSRPTFYVRAVDPDEDINVKLEVFETDPLTGQAVGAPIYDYTFTNIKGYQSIEPQYSLPDGNYVWRLTTSAAFENNPSTLDQAFTLLTPPKISNVSPNDGYVSENQPMFSFMFEDTNNYSLRNSTVELAYDGGFLYTAGLPRFYGGKSSTFNVPYQLEDGTYYYRITAYNDKNIPSLPVVGSFSVNTAKLASYEAQVKNSLPADSTISVPVVVKNIGTKMIRKEDVILTYRFIDTTTGRRYGAVPIRSPIPFDLPPGQSSSVDMNIATPNSANSSFKLIIELTEKAGSWFSAYQSPVFEKVVTIQDQYSASYSGRAPPVITSLPASFDLPITVTNTSSRTYLSTNTYLSYQIFNRDGQMVADGLSTKTALIGNLAPGAAASQNLNLNVNISGLKNNIYTLAIGLVETDGTTTTWFASKGVAALTYPIAIGKIGISSIPSVGGVNLATGNLTLGGTDFSLGGRGPNLAISRTYNSQDSSSTISGVGWKFNFETKLSDFGPYAQILSGDGGSIYFDKQLDGSYRALEGVKLKLTKNADLTYTLEDATKNKTYFRSNGLLDRVSDTNNNTLTFSYDASNRVSQITDATGRSVNIIYDASSRVNAIAYPASNTRGYTYTVYGYDSVTGNLTAVLVDPSDTATSYTGLDLITTYAYQNNKLTSITSPSGASTLRYEYTDGKVSKIIDPTSVPTNIVETTFTYYPDEAKAEVTNPMGAKTTYILGDYLNLKSVITPKVQVSDPDLITDYYFDNLNNLLATDVREGVDQRKGSTTIYQYDDTTDTGWANLVKTTTVDKETENYYESNTVYDENNYPVLSTDSKGNKTVLYYDKSGNIINVSDSTGVTAVSNYDAYGNVVYSTDAIASGANLVYNSNLEAITGFISTDWTYRKSIAISNPGAVALANYQVLLTIDTASLIAASKMRSDAADIRFTNIGGTEFSYWIESGINTSSTKIWVKVDSIAASPTTTTIYMNYGNSSATSASNAQSTFDFFDDFEAGFDSARFSGTATVIDEGTNKVLQITPGSNASSLGFSASEYILDYDLKFAAFGTYGPRLANEYKINGTSYLATGFETRIDGSYNSDWLAHGLARVDNDGARVFLAKQADLVAVNTWYHTKLTATNSLQRVEVAPFATIEATTANTFSGGFSFRTWDAGNNVRIDNLRVRKYAALEPTTALGAEENTALPDGYSFKNLKADNPGPASSLSSDAYSGLYSLKQSHTAINQESAIYTRLAAGSIKPYNKYVFSAYVKTESLVDNQGGVVIWVSWGKNRKLDGVLTPLRDDFSKPYKTNGAWQRIYFVATAPEDATTVNFQIRQNDFLGGSYVDALSVEEAGVISPYNLVENASFEAIGLTAFNWSAVNNTNTSTYWVKKDGILESNAYQLIKFNDNSYSTDVNGFIYNWLILGDFQTTYPEMAYDTDYLNYESSIKPYEGMKINGKTWFSWQDSDSTIDFNQILNITDFYNGNPIRPSKTYKERAAYASAYIYSQTYWSGKLQLRQSDNPKVWLNGESIPELSERKWAKSIEAIDNVYEGNVVLKEGLNRLLIKIADSGKGNVDINGTPIYGFKARFIEKATEAPKTDIKVYVSPLREGIGESPSIAGDGYIKQINNVNNTSSNIFTSTTPGTIAGGKQYTVSAYVRTDGLFTNFSDGAYAGFEPVEGVFRVEKASLIQKNELLDRSLIVTGPATLKEFTFEADIKFNSANKEASLLFGYTDKENYYRATIDANSNKVSIYRGATLLKSAISLLVALVDGTYKVAVTITGSNINVYVNSSLVLTTTDAAYTGGRVGLSTSKTSAYFDNIRLAPAGGTGGAKVVAEVKDAAGATLQTFTSDTYQTNGKWRLVAFDITAPTGSSFSKISLVQENFNGSTYFDSIRIEERLSTTIAYDAAGNYPIQTENPAGNKTDLTYDAVGNVKTVTTYKKINPADYSLMPTTTTYTYDTLSRVVAVTVPITNQASSGDYYNPTYVTAYNVYDKDGRLSAQVGVDGLIVAKSYLANGAVQSVTVGKDGQVLSQTIYEYDKAGNVIRTVNDPAGLAQETRATYDILGRLTSKTDPRGFAAGANPADYTTYYTYDIFSNLKTVVDARGYTTSFAYNGVGQKISQTDAKLNTTYFVYDANGNLAAQVNPTSSIDTSRNVAKTSDGAIISAIATGCSIINDTYVSGYGGAIDGDTSANSYAQIYSNSKTAPDPYFLVTLDKTYAISSIKVYLLDKSDGARSYKFKVETSIDNKNFKLVADKSDDWKFGIVNIDFATPVAVKYIKLIAIGARSPEADFFQVSEIEAITPNNSVVYDYDGEDRLIARTDAAGFTSYNYYNQSDELAFSVDAKGYVTSYEYDILGRLVKAIDPLGNFSTATYDEQGNVKEVFDKLGVKQKTATYDVSGALRRTENAIGHSTRADYDTAGRVVKITDNRFWDGPYNYVFTPISTIFNYDTFGRPYERIDSLGYRTNQVYDSLSRVVEVWDNNANFYNPTHSSSSIYQPTRTIYYQHNKINATIDPLGITQAYGYDANGNLTTSVADYGVGKLNQTTTFAYDELNRLTAVIDPRGNVTGANPADFATTFTYDERGNKISMTDSRGTTAYKYDENNRLIQTMDPLGKSTYFVYDPEGLLLSASSNANTINYTYDANNKLIKETFLNNTNDPNSLVTISYEYDAKGRLIKVTYNPSGLVTAYTYDEDDRLLTKDQNGRITNYRYDSMDNVTQMYDFTDMSNFYTYIFEYDKRNQLSAIRDLGTLNVIASFEYDPNGNMTKKTFFTLDFRVKTVTTYAYDAANRLIDIKTIKESSTGEISILDEASQANGNIVYDNLDNLITFKTNNYRYDIAEQLIEDNNYTYTYDGNGNILSRIEKATGLGITYTYNSANQLIQSIDTHLSPLTSVNYIYDAGGNLISDGIYTYVYDAKDRLVQVKQGLAVIAEYSYDLAGFRVSKTIGTQTTNYTYSDASSMPTVEYDSTSSKVFLGIPSSFGQLISLQKDGIKYYYVYDATGQIIGLVNAGGTFAVKYSYDSWGMPTEYDAAGNQVPVGTFGNPYLYKNYYYDAETGLYYLNARYYDPKTGRFITRDPDPGEISHRLSLNPYAYTYNNPITDSDPNGHGWWSSAVDWVTTQARRVVRTVRRAASAVASAVSSAYNAVSSAASSTYNAVASAASSAYNAVSSGARAVYRGAAAAGRAIGRAARSAVNTIQDRIANVKKSIEQRVSNIKKSIEERISNIRQSVAQRILNVRKSIEQRISNFVKDSKRNWAQNIKDINWAIQNPVTWARNTVVSVATDPNTATSLAIGIGIGGGLKSPGFGVTSKEALINRQNVTLYKGVDATRGWNEGYNSHRLGRESGAASWDFGQQTAIDHILRRDEMYLTPFQSATKDPRVASKYAKGLYGSNGAVIELRVPRYVFERGVAIDIDESLGHLYRAGRDMPLNTIRLTGDAEVLFKGRISPRYIVGEVDMDLIPDLPF